MTAFATAQELLERVEAQWIEELTSDADTGTADEARITRALDDATAELEGWLLRLPIGQRPSADTLRVHCVKVAFYLLTLDRPGKEFEQVRAAYADTIEYYKLAVADAQAGTGGTSSASMGVSDRPCPVFDDESLKGFV